MEAEIYIFAWYSEVSIAVFDILYLSMKTITGFNMHAKVVPILPVSHVDLYSKNKL